MHVYLVKGLVYKCTHLVCFSELVTWAIGTCTHGQGILCLPEDTCTCEDKMLKNSQLMGGKTQRRKTDTRIR